jgi:ubiquinone/menaquinone biosynthesis C-methylase UbiE
MSKQDLKEFIKFFNDYSKNVDDADNKFFWKLSDELIMSVLEKYIPENNSAGKSLVDLGGGTGRWIIKMSQTFRDLNFTLYDLSEDMINKAKENFEKNEMENVKIVQGDIKNLSALEDTTQSALFLNLNKSLTKFKKS